MRTTTKAMSSLFSVWLLLWAGAVLICVGKAHTGSIPHAQPSAVSARKAPTFAGPVDTRKAKELFLHAWKENKRLKWDACLGDRAVERARDLVRKNFFGHKDPNTGKNAAWDLIASCRPCRYGGENLVKGGSSAEEMHRLLMQSSAHRANILSPRFTLLGVGCYQDICVQLFAGS